MSDIDKAIASLISQGNNLSDEALEYFCSFIEKTIETTQQIEWDI